MESPEMTEARNRYAAMSRQERKAWLKSIGERMKSTADKITQGAPNYRHNHRSPSKYTPHVGKKQLAKQEKK